jgi:1-acyl-sn-glycerol-3-phosphate acyltransferase
VIKILIKLIQRMTGWKDVGTPPDIPRYVMVAAPHTSNWDFPILLSYARLHDVPLRFLAKDGIFKFPFGPLLKWMGGVPVDRSAKHNLVERMAEVINQQDQIVVSVPPEGTRKIVPHWKSGFYYLALAAKVPLVLSYIDGPGKRYGIGPVIYPTGDIVEDMKAIRAFYEKFRGVNPGLTSEVIVRQEWEERQLSQSG